MSCVCSSGNHPQDFRLDLFFSFPPKRKSIQNERNRERQRQRDCENCGFVSSHFQQEDPTPQQLKNEAQKRRKQEKRRPRMYPKVVDTTVRKRQRETERVEQRRSQPKSRARHPGFQGRRSTRRRRR